MLTTMTPAQCRAARALLDWTQPTLAAAAKLGLSTIVDFEKMRRKTVSPDAVAAIRTALEAAGVTFLDNGDVAAGPGVALQGERNNG